MRLKGQFLLETYIFRKEKIPMGRFSEIFEYTKSAEEGGTPFHNLFEGIVSAGGMGYVICLTIAIIIALIACSAIFLKLFVADNGKDMTEQKDKLVRNLLLVVFLMLLGSLVTWIYNAFLW